MTGHEWHDSMVGALLAIAVFAVMLCCAGMVAMRRSLDRLHYVSAALILGPLPLAAAVLVEEGLSSSGVNTILTVSLMILTGPFVTHATAKALHRARAGSGPTEQAR
ncbi:MAG TPA: monovalent cation/H(+) antiporter subunit G [Nitrospiraceae bacterium]|nr:monovalent cation/H(+) antiporter subunit G [Nitrospiraceae bacterium]